MELEDDGDSHVRNFSVLVIFLTTTWVASCAFSVHTAPSAFKS